MQSEKEKRETQNQARRIGVVSKQTRPPTCGKEEVTTVPGGILVRPGGTRLKGQLTLVRPFCAYANAVLPELREVVADFGFKCGNRSGVSFFFFLFQTAGHQN